MNYEAIKTSNPDIESTTNLEKPYYPSFFKPGLNWNEAIEGIQQSAEMAFNLNADNYRKAGITEGLILLGIIFNNSKVRDLDHTKNEAIEIKKNLFEGVHNMRNANLNEQDRELLGNLIPVGEKTLEEYKKPFILDLKSLESELTTYKTKLNIKSLKFELEEKLSDLSSRDAVLTQIQEKTNRPNIEKLNFISKFYTECFPEDVKEFYEIRNMEQYNFAHAFVNTCVVLLTEMNFNTIDSKNLIKQTQEAVLVFDGNFIESACIARDKHLQKYFGKNYQLTKFEQKVSSNHEQIDLILNNPKPAKPKLEAAPISFTTEELISAGYVNLNNFPKLQADKIEKNRKYANSERVKLMSEVAISELEIGYFLTQAPDSIKKYSTSWNSICNIKDLKKCMHFFCACENLLEELLPTNMIKKFDWIEDRMKSINIMAFEGEDRTARFDALYAYIIGESYTMMDTSKDEYKRITELLPPYNCVAREMLDIDRERMNGKREIVIEEFIAFHELTKGYEQSEQIVESVIQDVVYNDLNGLDRNNPFTYFQEVFQGKSKSNNDTKRVIYQIKEGVKKYFESRETQGLTPAQLEKLEQLKKISKEDFQKLTQEVHKILSQHTGFVIKFKDQALKLTLAAVLFNDQWQIVQDLLDKRDKDIEAKLTRLLKEVEALDSGLIKVVQRKRIEFKSITDKDLDIENLGENYQKVKKENDFWGDDSVVDATRSLRRQYQVKQISQFEAEGNPNPGEYIDSVRREIIKQSIPVKEIMYSDGTVVFLIKEMAIITQQKKETQAIFHQGFSIDEMELLFQDFEGKFNPKTIQEFCFYNGYRYFSLKHKGKFGKDGSLTDYNWKKEQAELINNPKSFSGWKINLPKEYSRETMEELTSKGLSFWAISALGNLIGQYKESSQIDLNIDKGITSKRLQAIHDGIKFKSQVDADEAEKVFAPKTLLGLVSDPNNPDLPKNEFVADYVNSLSRYYDWVERLSEFYESYKSIGIADEDRELYESLKKKMASLGKVFGRDSAYFTEKSFIFGSVIYGQHTPLTDYIDTFASAVPSLANMAYRLAKLKN